MSIKKSFNFTILGQLWDLNDIINIAKKHYRAYKEAHDGKLEDVGWAIVSANPIPMKRIGIKIVWYEKDRRRNKDNIVAGGLKLILDALQVERVIKNDGWKEIGTVDVFNFKVDKQNPRIEVSIWEEK